MNNLSLANPPPPDMPAPPPDGGNALAMGGGPPQPQGGAQPGQSGQSPIPQPPAPTHEQTVAALRHFQAVQAELEPLLQDPALGKADMKSKVIDGATKLVMARIFGPADAVAQLADFPEHPVEQRDWLIRHYFMASVGMHQVLDHHGAAAAAGMVPKHGSPKREDHLHDIKGLMGHYKGKANG